MRVLLGSDHNGFELKREIAELLTATYSVSDVGAHTFDPQDDYPDFARLLATTLIKGEADRGILICGSGVGASVAANKVPGIRAAVCHDTYSARQGVEHDDMNVVVIGARVIGPELAREVVRAFLQARFSGEERHLRRLDKVKAMERELLALEQPVERRQ